MTAKDSADYDWANVVDPFQRRISLSRSPPGSRRGSCSSNLGVALKQAVRRDSTSSIRSVGSSASAKGETTGNVSSEELSGGVKRRRATEDQQSLRTPDMKEMIAKLEVVVRELNNNITVTPNRKADIKKGIVKAGRLVEVINRQYAEGEIYSQERKVPKLDVNRETKDIGIQVCSGDIEDENKATEQRMLNEIRSIVENQGEFGDVAGILDKAWPEKVYKATKRIAGNPAKLVNDGDFAILMNAKNCGGKGIIKQMMERYPEMTEITNDGLNEGQIEFLEITTRVATSRAEKEGKSKFLYLLPFTCDETGVNNMEIVYKLIKKLKEQIQQNNRVKLNVVIPEGLSMDYVRKLAEYLFNDTNIEINTVVPKNINGGDSIKLEPKKEATQEIIVRSEGKTYCELLKSIKEIKSTLKEADVRVMRHESVLHITDIPATENESSELKDIMDDMGILDSQALRVKPLRPLQDGNQAATVIIRRDLANKMVRRGVVKIGWVYCRVWHRNYVQRCYRCLEYGHNRNDCSGPDRSEECLNCGATGYRAKECQNSAYCPKCYFNAKSREWGSPIENRRGMYLAEYIFRQGCHMAALDIVAHNSDGTPTFQRVNSESFIDITLSTQRVVKKITNWKVMENETLSDHKHIYFEIMGAGAKQNIERQRPIIDKKKLEDLLKQKARELQTNGLSSAQELGDALSSIYKKSCIRGGRTVEWLPFWWNEEIEHKKRECDLYCDIFPGICGPLVAIDHGLVRLRDSKQISLKFRCCSVNWHRYGINQICHFADLGSWALSSAAPSKRSLKRLATPLDNWKSTVVNTTMSESHGAAITSPGTSFTLSYTDLGQSKSMMLCRPSSVLLRSISLRSASLRLSDSSSSAPMKDHLLRTPPRGRSLSGSEIIGREVKEKCISGAGSSSSMEELSSKKRSREEDN
nr:unnamed protein product [Callosobruchus analis]